MQSDTLAWQQRCAISSAFAIDMADVSTKVDSYVASERLESCSNEARSVN